MVARSLPAAWLHRVEGLRDPESDLLQAVRDEFGNSLPIGISYDLHANVTEANARLATFIVGYLTNPHRDHYRTGYTSGEILCRTVLGEIEPVMAFRKMRLLKGGMNIDFCRQCATYLTGLKRI